MRQIVLDTSIAIKWFFPENGSGKALRLKRDHVKGKSLLCSRDLLLYEFVSALKNYSPLKIEEKDFKLATAALQAMRLKIYSLEYTELAELFRLSRKVNLSIYDSAYILLAKRLRTSLYTADKKLFLASKTFVRSFLI